MKWLQSWFSFSPKIGDYTSRRDNNFHLMRMLAALAVILSHSFVFARHQPLSQDLTLGNLAVRVFFVISGFLITRSWLNHGDLRAFLLARAARIYPALWVLLLLTVFLIGWRYTALDTAAYFRKGQTWEYLGANATLLMDREKLSGVFPGSPFPEKVNGSLWTLRYEMFFYLLIALLGLCGVLKDRGRFLVLAICGFLFLIFVEKLGERGFTKLCQFIGFTGWKIQYLAVLYLAGAALCIFRQSIPLTWGCTALMAAIAAGGLAIGQKDLIFSVGFAYIVIALAFLPAGWIRRYNRVGDYSYGTYIYAAPIQAMLVLTGLFGNPWLLFLVSVPAALLPAILSWHLIEKPSLAWARRWIKKWEKPGAVLP